MGEKILFKDESYAIQGAAYDVYKELGCGQKESVYQNAFALALEERGLYVEREPRLLMKYRGKKVGVYVPDFVINKKILIELKAKPHLSREDLTQFWQYLRSTEFLLGYLINFGKSGKVQLLRRIYETARSAK